jgi:hypothetical protein
MECLRCRRTYDYRIQEAICESGDRDLFPELNIPPSTIRSWIHRGSTEVVSCESAGGERPELVAEIEKLRCRTALLGAVVGLLISILRVSKVQLDYERLPEGDAKRILLRAIKRARKALPLSATLRITRLSASRYHGWCRTDTCRCEPWRFTPNELGRSLPLHRRGIGWSERKAGDAPRIRVYPAKPKVGIRAKAPGGIGEIVRPGPAGRLGLEDAMTS